MFAAHPDWLRALGGGLLIGLAASLLLLVNGRIAGISGLLAAAIGRKRDGLTVTLAFLAGLLGGGALLALAWPRSLPAAVPGSLPVLAVAGVLVGFGTRLGGGCTSGHGVCGVGRFSTRSLVATATFMALGALTVLVTRHVLGGA